MKSALLAVIFGVTGGVAILAALPTAEKPPVIKIQPPKSFPDYGEPVVPQIEEMPPQEALLPEPSDHYLIARASSEKPAARHHEQRVHHRPSFFEKLLASFIKLQKRQDDFVNGLRIDRTAE